MQRTYAGLQGVSRSLHLNRATRTYVLTGMHVHMHGCIHSLSLIVCALRWEPHYCGYDHSHRTDAVYAFVRCKALLGSPDCYD
jgi:hypothetical protein